MDITQHRITTSDGWKLVLQQRYNSKTLDKNKRPLVIVPGYGMNAFIFGYHPNGISMEEHLVQRGFEVWSLNLRGMGESSSPNGKRCYGMRELSLIDLPACVDYIVENNRAGQDKVDLIGCSLGGTMVYTYASLHGTEKLGSIVTMGAPLRWVSIHPVLKFAFSSPTLIGMIPFAHTRTLARHALPVMKKIPALLAIYLHPEIVDLSHPEILAQTVEDPNPKLNREIAVWIKRKDLVIDGVNVSERFGQVDNPLFLMLANADGIVPPDVALSAGELTGSQDVQSITAGDDSIQMAHADMFISDYAQELVFDPMADWLDAHE